MRETKKIKTKSGVEIEMKTYLTGREMRELREIFLEGAELKTEGEITKIEGLKGTIIKEVEDKSIELVVVSVNGETEKIMGSILDLPSKDYQEVIDEVNKVSAFEFSKKK